KFICRSASFDRARAEVAAATFRKTLLEVAREPGREISTLLDQVPAELTLQKGVVTGSMRMEEPTHGLGTTDVENALLRIWHDDFGISELGVQDNWADLGIQSALIVRVHARIR